MSSELEAMKERARAWWRKHTANPKLPYAFKPREWTDETVADETVALFASAEIEKAVAQWTADKMMASRTCTRCGDEFFYHLAQNARFWHGDLRNFRCDFCNGFCSAAEQSRRNLNFRSISNH